MNKHLWLVQYTQNSQQHWDYCCKFFSSREQARDHLQFCRQSCMAEFGKNKDGSKKLYRMVHFVEK